MEQHLFGKYLYMLLLGGLLIVLTHESLKSSHLRFLPNHLLHFTDKNNCRAVPTVQYPPKAAINSHFAKLSPTKLKI